MIKAICFVTRLFFLTFFCLLGACRFSKEKDNLPVSSTDWPIYGGNKAGNRYSPLSRINLGNVNHLRVAWIYDAQPQNQGKSEMECQPIVVRGILYATSPQLILFALDAASGKKIWEFNPFKDTSPNITTSRGVAYWENNNDKRILFSAGHTLYAIDAETGQPIRSFGADGQIDLHTGLSNHYDANKLYVVATTPGVIYKNLLILGSAVSEGGDAAPGDIRAFDVLSGQLKWVFHTVPGPGEFGYETWPKDAYKKIGAANNWSGMTLDEKRGTVYLGTGSPASDFYGGARAGINLFSDCILALDAASGQLKWYFQTIHHDLWDRDIPCAPNLASITFQGKKKDVVVQTTKDGLLYVLDRDSGTSIFPIEEKKVPTKGLPGEQPWPLQKYPVKPLPFSNQVFTEADITDISTGSHDVIQKLFDSTIHSNKFDPPGERATLLYGYSGGAEWGGNAIDPGGILYQNANNALWRLQMETASNDLHSKKDISPGKRLYVAYCSSCHRPDMKGNGVEIPSLVSSGLHLSEKAISNVLQEGRRRMPSFKQLLPDEKKALIGFLLNKPEETREKQQSSKPVQSAQQKTAFPYLSPFHAKIWEKVYDPEGYPAVKPPWGTLSAIDLSTGKYCWQIPLGEYPELTKRGMPVTGTENYGGPLVTAGGLVFIAATRDEKIRAFNKQNGKVVWEYQLPAAGFATPITYEIKNKQYIVIAAGGGRGLKSGGAYIAFALPENE